MTLVATSVLVVEDHDFQRRTTLRILANLGIGTLHEAADGPDALEALDQLGGPDRPDVVICDLDLPGMDGVELLRRIAERRHGQAVVIASGLEASVLDAAAATAREYGLDVLGVLPKPLSAGRLVESLERLPRPADDSRVMRALAGPWLGLERASDGAVVAVWAAADGQGWPEDLVGFACQAHRALIAAGRSLPVIVLLGDGLDSRGLPDRLAARAALEGVAPRHLTLVTDAGDTATAREILTRLRVKGFELRPAGPALADADRVRDVAELLARLEGP